MNTINENLIFLEEIIEKTPLNIFKYISNVDITEKEYWNKIKNENENYEKLLESNVDYIFDSELQEYRNSYSEEELKNTFYEFDIEQGYKLRFFKDKTIYYHIDSDETVAEFDTKEILSKLKDKDENVQKNVNGILE